MHSDPAARAVVPALAEAQVGGAKVRLQFIDVLRALAVAAVFLLHVRGYWAEGTESRDGWFVVDRIAAQGAAGVDLFIVLSGFCMTYPLVRGRGDGIAAISPSRFYRRRAVRLLPAYYAALVIVIVLLSVPDLQELMVAEPVDWIDVLTHVLLVQPFNSQTIGAINGPLWSISLEATLYLVFPVALAVLRRWGWAALLAGSMAVGLIWFGLDSVARREAASNDWLAGMHYWLPAHLFEFVLGMYAARLVCHPRQGQFRAALLALPVASVIGAAGTIGGVELIRTFGWGIAAFALTIVASVVCDKRQVRRVVAIVARMGIVSYSFYLLHQPLLLLASSGVDRLGLGPAGVYLVLMPLGFLAITAVAWVFFRLFERPFLLAGSMRDAILPEEPLARAKVESVGGA